MAFTQAKQVADLVKRSVLPGVEISIGKSRGVEGIEVVVRGYQHPEDGMTRLWIIDLIGQSGMMLDLVIMGLRKAGFDMRGSAPMMKGVLTEVLTRQEIAQMRAKEREDRRKKEEVEFQAKLQGETLAVSKHANEKIGKLEEEIDRLKQMIEDMALLPQPRGPRGEDGRDGRDGKDGSIAELADAELSDLGDVLKTRAEERQVLTFKDGKWQPLYVPRFSGNIYAGGGGGGGEAVPGPAGPQGPQGPQGEPGVDGVDGKSAYQVAVDHGFTGTEEEWLDSLRGEDGKTAYELAVEGGFVGTQEEWVDSLKGEQGPPGEGGTGGLTIQIRNREDVDGEPTFVQTEVTTISFDSDSGFVKDDLGQGEAFIKINSTFNPWHVDGQETLDATGEEPVEFVAGPGMTITTDANSDPKQIIFESSGAGGAQAINDLTDVNTELQAPTVGQTLVWNGTNWVPGAMADGSGIGEAPTDGRYYVRQSANWVELSCALKALMVGDGGQFSPEGDGGNFTTGYTGTHTDRQLYDGSNITSGATEAIDDKQLDGQYIYSPYGEGGDFTHDDANGDSTSEVETARGYDGGNFSSESPSQSCEELDGGEFC